jgi:hypothetical protein
MHKIPGKDYKDYREDRKRKRKYLNDFFKETFRTQYKATMKPVTGASDSYTHRKKAATIQVGLQTVSYNRKTRRALARSQATSYKGHVQ